jgi:hypothetical protein
MEDLVPNAMVGLWCVALIAVAVWKRRQRRRCLRCKDGVLRFCNGFAGPPEPASFYRCDRCRLRLRETTRGSWEDASGPEYDGHYLDAPEPPPRPVTSYRENG